MTVPSPIHTGWFFEHGRGLLVALRKGAAPSAAALAANTAIEGVLEGTPVVAAIPADSMVFVNAVASGDILFVLNDGSGNAWEYFRMDGSAAGMIFNEGGSNVDFRVESDNIQYAIFVDGGKDALVFGSNTDTSSADQLITISRAARTATANTSYYDVRLAPAGAVTVPAGTTAIVASLSLVEPNVTATGTVTRAATLHIASQPTEGGTANAAILFGAAANIACTTSLTFNEDSEDIDFRFESNGMAYAIYSDGGKDALVLGSNTDTSSADQLITVSRAARTATANVSYYDLALQPAGAVTVPAGTTAVVATLQVAEPNVTATGTVTTAATIYVASQPTEGTDNGAIVLADGLWLGLGTNADQVLVNAPSTIANTAITGVLLGTPVTPAIAADTLVVSNTTASGDILLAANLGGNSQAWLWVDTSASLLTLYAAGVSAIEIGAGGVVVNEASADRDFRIESNDIASMLVVDAGANSIGLGGAVVSGATVAITANNVNYTLATSVGYALHFATETLTTNNADPTTTAIGARLFIGGAAIAGAFANQVISDAAQIYVASAPAQGTNMIITRAWSLWVDAGNVRFDGNVDMAAAASDIVIIAATAAALEISDGTTKFYAFDTRVATAGVTTHALDISDYTFASGATNVATGLSLAAHTLNYTGNTQVTTHVNTASLLGRTIAGDTATLTVDAATTLRLVAPVEGTNVAITACSALRIGDAGGTPVNQYGIFIETLTAGATADYAIWVAGANAVHLGTAGTATGLLEIDGATSGTATITAAAATTSYTLTLPAAANTNVGYQLTCAAGDTITSWAAAASLREYKDVHGRHDPQDALDKILKAKVYDFNYKHGKGTQDKTTRYTGVMADEAPWAMHYEGGVVNPVNTLGFTILAFQAMAQELAAMKRKLASLGV